jgi:hypothetical protein
MAIDSISSVSPIIAQAPASRMDRSRETPPVEQAPEAGTRVANPTPASVITAPENAETALRESSAQISRANQPGGQTPMDQRTAAQAYNTEASALDKLAVERQGNGSRTLDVLA